MSTISSELTVTDQVLQHYGVKGMKWGQSKAETPPKADPVSPFAGINIGNAGGVKSGFGTPPENPFAGPTGGVGSGGYDEDAELGDEPLTDEEAEEILKNGGQVKRGPDGKLREVINRRLDTQEDYQEAIRRGDGVEKDDKGNWRINPDSEPVKKMDPIVNDISADDIRKGLKDLVDRILGHADSGGELMHFGVKGMKWGVRKDRSSRSSGSSSSSTSTAKRMTAEEISRAVAKPTKAPSVPVKRGSSADAITSSLLKTLKPYEMTNAELKFLTERMQLEQKFSQLTAPKPSPLKEFAMTQGKQIIGSLVQTYARQKINQLVGAPIARPGGGAKPKPSPSPTSSPSPKPAANKPAPKQPQPKAPAPQVVYDITSLPKKK